MFRLYDQTRRRICLAGFFGLCIVPTIATAAWCVWRHTPAHVDAVARRLGSELRLDVSLAGVRHLGPGVEVYEDLKISDPETDREIIRCRMLRAEWTQATDAQGRRRPTLVLLATEPEIDAAGVDRLGKVLDRLLRWQLARRAVDVRLSAGEVVLKTDEKQHTLTHLWGTLEAFPGGAQARVDFHLKGVNMMSPIQIRLVHEQGATPGGGFELDTAGAAVPCDLLATGLPALEPLGQQASFGGSIWATRSVGGWKGEVNGRFFNLDLDRLIGERFSHRLSGTAEVGIRLARFHDGRLEYASGNLVAGPGLIGRSLLDASVQHLGLARGPEPKTPGRVVPYELLAVEFRMDPQGLALRGQCKGTGSGTILLDRYSRLLGEPALQPQPVSGLVKALVPAGDQQVPAARQSQWLMQYLPVPEMAAAGSTEAGRSSRQ